MSVPSLGSITSRCSRKWARNHLSSGRIKTGPGRRRKSRLSLVWISKPVVSRLEGEAISLSVLYYWFLVFLCRCRSFNPSLCRFSPFLLHCRCSKAMSLVRIYPNGAPALTGSSPGTKETDRVINTSNHFIVPIKLYVDLDVGNVEDIVSFFVILAAASWTVF